MKKTLDNTVLYSNLLFKYHQKGLCWSWPNFATSPTIRRSRLYSESHSSEIYWGPWCTLKGSPAVNGKNERVFSPWPHFPSRRAFLWMALSVKVTFRWRPTSASVSSSWGLRDTVTSMLKENTETEIKYCFVLDFLDNKNCIGSHHVSTVLNSIFFI